MAAPVRGVMVDQPAVRLIGVPLDLGAGRRGVDMGPSSLRIAGIASALQGLGCRVEDAGNIDVPQRETLGFGDDKLRFLGPISQVCRRLYQATTDALNEGLLPVILGGDHSLAIGSIAAAADAARAQGGRLGVFWLDAHGDMNTGRTTVSGNIHGMPLACLMGEGVETLTSVASRIPALDPEDVVLMGIRSIDDSESENIRRTGVHTVTMRNIDERGLRVVLSEAIERLLKHCDRLHVSFDVDFLDPSIAPGVGTRVRGGPNYREAHLVMEILADTGRVSSLDIVEVNPILDRENSTSELAVELVASLFGRRIL